MAYDGINLATDDRPWETLKSISSLKVGEDIATCLDVGTMKSKWFTGKILSIHIDSYDPISVAVIIKRDDGGNNSRWHIQLGRNNVHCVLFAPREWDI